MRRLNAIKKKSKIDECSYTMFVYSLFAVHKSIVRSIRFMTLKYYTHALTK